MDANFVYSICNFLVYSLWRHCWRKHDVSFNKTCKVRNNRKLVLYTQTFLPIYSSHISVYFFQMVERTRMTFHIVILLMSIKIRRCPQIVKIPWTQNPINKWFYVDQPKLLIGIFVIVMKIVCIFQKPYTLRISITYCILWIS